MCSGLFVLTPRSATRRRAQNQNSKMTIIENGHERPMTKDDLPKLQAALVEGASESQPTAARCAVARGSLAHPHNPNHPVGTCAKCGAEMTYNVPRIGPAGGYIHKATASFDCGEPENNLNITTCNP